MKTKRQPCPFCGEDRFVAHVGEPTSPSGLEKRYEAYIHCLGCRTRFSWLVIGAMDSTREDVAAHVWENWGRRINHEQRI